MWLRTGCGPAYRAFPEVAAADGEPPNIWSRHGWIPAATIAAYRDTPAALVLHFELGGGSPGPVDPGS
jgi:hypothetical protein